MKVTFDAGGGPVILADHTANPKLLGVVERNDREVIVQQEPLYAGTNPFLAPRGNAAGQFVFTVHCSSADYNSAVAYEKAELARVGGQGALVYTAMPAGTAETYANAVLKNVQVVETNGVARRIRYTFITLGIA